MINQIGTPGFEPGVTRTRIVYVTVTPRSVSPAPLQWICGVYFTLPRSLSG